MANELIGLDIGSSSIKLVRLKQNNKFTSLKNFAIAPLPPEAIVDGALMNTSAITETLGNLLKSMKIKAEKVALSISGHSVFVRFIRTSNYRDEELEEHIKWDAESYIPDVNDVYLDFHKLTSMPDASGEIEVLLVAAKRNIIDEYDQLAKSVGLKPAIVDVDAFAIQNTYEYNYPDRFKNEVVALLNIGAAVTTINIVDKGVSKFVRDMSSGGAEITAAISQHYGLPVEEAENIKIGVYGGNSDLVNSNDLHRIYEEVSYRIAGEILQTIDYFKTTTPGIELNRIYLTGGGSKINLIQKRLEEQAGVRVEELNPFNNINIDPRAFNIDFIRANSSLATVAVGLALRKADDKW